jgi:protein-tyrosine phosphatase
MSGTSYLSEIVPNLWQGSRHSISKFLDHYKFNVLVLCAEEWQPPKSMFPDSVEVIYSPNADDPFRDPTRNELLRAVQTGRRVAIAVRRDKKVLTTCMAGLNRSGLVNALALHFLTGEDGRTCMRRVRLKRLGALGNVKFQQVLSRVPPIHK